jgi:endonuclease III
MAKRPKLPEVLDVLGKLYGKPRTAEHPEAPLLDHLLVGVLSAWVDRERAARALRVASESFLDLNEARVSPLAELRAVLEPSLGAKAGEAAVAFRLALQDVFDGTHGLDLEPLRGREPDDLKKFLREMPHTMGGPAASVFQLAIGDSRLALMQTEARVLDRLGLLPKTATAAKARVALEKTIRSADRLPFAWAIGSHAAAVCRAKDPKCETCVLLEGCRFGVEEVKRRVLERKKDEARRAAEEKRRLEAEAKAARIRARVDAAAAKKKAIEDARVARAQAALAKKAAEKAAVEAKRKAAIEAAKAAAEAKKKAVIEARRKAEADKKKAAAEKAKAEVARRRAEAEKQKAAAAAKKAKKPSKK